jgi:hypothetical protein
VTRGGALGTREARTLTVGEYARRWLGEFVDAAADIDRYRRDVAEQMLPAVGSSRLVEVTAAEIVALLEQVGADTSPAVADQVRATLRELFVDAAGEGLIGRSPVPASQSAAASPAPP